MSCAYASVVRYGGIVRHTVLVLTLALALVSGVSGAVSVLATTGRSACQVDSPEGDFDLQAMFKLTAYNIAKRTLPVR